MNTYPQLVAVKGCEDFSNILINKKKFTIGRSTGNSIVLPYVNISRSHCVFRNENCHWTITDLSTSGTFVNGDKISKKSPQRINHHDEIRLGSLKDKFIYTFVMTPDDVPPLKKIKTDHTNQSNAASLDTTNDSQESSNFTKEMWNEIQKMKEKHELEKAFLQSQLEAKNQMQTEILNQKKQVEDSLERERLEKQKLMENESSLSTRLHEMQEKLKEQEKIQKETIEQLNEKEKQRLCEIESMKEKQRIEKQELYDKMKDELKLKELTIRENLESEINALKTEKQKLDITIKDTQKKCGDAGENLDVLVRECEKVTKDLEASVSKKRLLDEQLENVDLADRETPQNLQARDDILSNFEKLMENELQCSICNELFVKAVILNCSHSFCTYCITEWRKKKNDCPVCRTIIKAENRSLVLDNFIDKMVENLSTDMKNRRQEIVEDRLARELMIESMKKKKKRKSMANSQQRRRSNQPWIVDSVRTRSTSRRTRNPVRDAPSTSTAEIIVITEDDDSNYSLISSSSNDSSSYDSPYYNTSSFNSSNDFLTENTSDSCPENETDLDWNAEDSARAMRGRPGAYYGGYGHCYTCGAAGHWSNGCPLRLP